MNDGVQPERVKEVSVQSRERHSGGRLNRGRCSEMNLTGLKADCEPARGGDPLARMDGGSEEVRRNETQHQFLQVSQSVAYQKINK